MVIEKDGERYILAADRQAAYERELEEAATVGTLTGAELAGRRYEPLFGYLADAERFGTGDAFRVILSDDVTTEDGTGVVHMAPAYGEADNLACTAAGIPTVLTVDERGQFTARGARLRGPARLRRQRRDRGPAARAGQPGAPGDLHPLLPALLALP